MTGDAGEFGLIRRFFDRAPVERALLGIGDDCALLSPLSPGHVLAVSTDMLVAGRHFFEDVAPRALGHKALAVNLSDLAAMGARPLAFTLALSLPERNDPWLEEFSLGLLALARTHDIELVGGDTTRGPLNICITVMGEVPPAGALRRDAAREGDDLWVSGPLGAAAHAVQSRLAGTPLADDSAPARSLLWPQPRVALGLALRGVAHAAIDLSDGLLGDLGHVARRSGLGARIDATRLPLAPCLAGLPRARQLELALAGGDDYELLFSAPVQHRERLLAWTQSGAHSLSLIGCMVSGNAVIVHDEHGREIDVNAQSFDHFRVGP